MSWKPAWPLMVELLVEDVNCFDYAALYQVLLGVGGQLACLDLSSCTELSIAVWVLEWQWNGFTEVIIRTVAINYWTCFRAEVGRRSQH